MHSNWHVKVTNSTHWWIQKILHHWCPSEWSWGPRTFYQEQLSQEANCCVKTLSRRRGCVRPTFAQQTKFTSYGKVIWITIDQNSVRQWCTTDYQHQFIDPGISYLISWNRVLKHNGNIMIKIRNDWEIKLVLKSLFHSNTLHAPNTQYPCDPLSNSTAF